MKLFAIFTRSSSDFDLFECEDFHSAAELGLRVANNEGHRLLGVDIALEVPVMDGTPQIGIFWWVEAANGDAGLLVDCVPMAKAEIYGEFLTYGAHYEYWRKLAVLDDEALRERFIPNAVRWTEYEDWPRGRIVLHQPTGRFVLYADRKLWKPAIIEEIMRRFSIPADRTDVRSDSHYVSNR
jgi:hypothetical protein